MERRTYQVGASRITLIFGDITTSRAQVLVSSDDYQLTMGGGVSAAIRRAGGHRIRDDARKLTPLQLADVAVSTAGDLPARYVMHAVTIGPFAEDLAPDVVVRQTTQRALRLAASLGCTSIAFPSICSGVAPFPAQVVATQMAGAIVDYLLDAEPPMDVELYLMDRHLRGWQIDLWPFFETFAGATRALETHRGPEGAVLSPPREAQTGDHGGADDTSARRRQIFEMLRVLDARRGDVEAELFAAMSHPSREVPGLITGINRRLDELRTVREGYERELSKISEPSAPAVGDSVFVSSTSADLKEHREAVRSAIEQLKLKFIGMEDFGQSACAPADFIRKKVESAQVYMGIIGMRYGSVEAASGLSMTEIEYRQARMGGKELLMYVMSDDAVVTVKMIESDPERFAKLQQFRTRVMSEHTCGMFRDADELATKVRLGLSGVFAR